MKLFKTIGRFVLHFFGGKKTFDIDGDGKIENLREEVNGVFAQFIKMNNKLNKVNEQLQEVVNAQELDQHVIQEELEKHIASEQAKIAQTERVIAKAAAEMEANRKLQEKVKEFIV